MIELNKERVVTPAEVVVFGSGLQSGLGAFNGSRTSCEHRVQSKDVDGDFALFIEVGELLNTECVFILDPRLQDCTAAVIPSIAVAVTHITESQEYTRYGTSIN